MTQLFCFGLQHLAWVCTGYNRPWSYFQLHKPNSKLFFMKLLRLSTIVILTSILTTTYGQQAVPFNDKRWVIQAQGQMQEAYKGKNSLYLQGGMAYLKDANFLNGIIEFDVYLAYQVSFSGMIFRLADPANYEELYLRAQQSGYPDAYQYTPVFNNDPAWQLYHDQYDGVNDGFISWKPRGKTMGYNGVLNFLLTAGCM
jgi:hypothetical protein